MEVLHERSTNGKGFNRPFAQLDVILNALKSERQPRRTHSCETRAKMSASHRARWAEIRRAQQLEKDLTQLTTTFVRHLCKL
jgi:hypothetical protein